MLSNLKQPLQTLSLSPSGRLLAVAFGGSVQIVDVETGKLQCTTDPADSHKGGLVRQLVWWEDSKLVSSGDDKALKEWHFQGDRLVLKEHRELPKRANAVRISKDGQTVIVGDKFGDVYAFPLSGCNPYLPEPPKPIFPSEASTSSLEPTASTSIDSSGKGAAPANPAAPTKGQKQDRITKIGILKDNTNGPQWRHVPARVSALAPCVGHVSLITDLLLREDGEGKQQIITADRDEHIRVSRWPQGWEIEHFLLGQRKFVSALARHPDRSDLLLSAGGDDHLRIWSLDTFECLKSDISLEPLKGTAEITIRIGAAWHGKGGNAKRKKNEDAQNGEQGKRARLSEGAEASGEPASEQTDTVAERSEAVSTEKKPRIKIKKLDLGIQKIVFAGFGRDKVGEDSLTVLTSLGSSSLLAYKTSTLLDSSAGRASQTVDLGYPVLGVTALPSSRFLWVSLDVSTAEAESTKAVRCFEVSGDGQLVEGNHTTLKTLNEDCSSPVNAGAPFPDHATLYPDISLLSKDPSDRLNDDGAGGGGNEEAEEELAQD